MVKKKRARGGGKNRRRNSGIKRNTPLNFTERESRLKNRRKRTRFLLITVIAFVFIASSGIYWAITSHISSIEVITDSNDLRVEVEAQTYEYLESTTDKTLLVDEDEMQNYLVTENTRIKAVNITTRHFNNILKITVSERTPVLLLQSRGMQFYVDNNGFAFQHRAEKEESQLPLVIDESSLTIPVGEQAVSKDFVTFITTVDNSLKSMKQGVKFYKTTGVTKNIIATTRDNIAIIFDTENNINNQIEKLQQTLAHIKQQKTDIQRIDLRTNKKVFIE